MQQLPTGGAMSSVEAGEARVRAVISGFEDGVSIAALNTAESTVISGDSDTAQAKLDAIEALGHHTVRNPAEIGDTVAKAVAESGVGLGNGPGTGA